MEDLIKQAFLHVDVIGPLVADGNYDLIGPNGDIILPQVWNTMIEPDWSITMHMWPVPEKEEVPAAVPVRHKSGKHRSSRHKDKIPVPPGLIGPVSRSGTPKIIGGTSAAAIIMDGLDSKPKKKAKGGFFFSSSKGKGR